jgi:hypothetical protein
MAVTKTILKNHNQAAIVKVGGTDGSATIDLQTDLLAATQALDGATQTVNIASVTVTGLLGSAITITRGGVPVLAFAPENSAKIQFNESGFVDTQNNTDDLVVTVSGAEAHVVLVLHKSGGYASKVETATYSIYDNVNAVGS